MNTLIGKSNNKGLNWARSKKVILFTEIAGQARNDGHNRHIHSRYSDESQNLLQVKETFRTSSGNRMNRKSAIFLLLLCLFFGNVQATVRYVKSGATGTGASWANASGNLQAMINASASGDEVWVAAGTYKPAYTAANWTSANPATTDGVRDNAFVMKPGVKIYGGFPTGASDVNNNTLSSRNWVANQTILSGDIGTAGTATDNIYHVVIAAGNLGTALLDGFTITGGYGNTSSSITVNGRSIARNYGAGITVHGTMTFSNLTVKANIASSGYGSGIHLNGNSSEGSTFTNIVIAGNTGAQDGGGIYVRAMTHTMSNVTVADNKAGYGGGICIRGGALHLRNSIVWGNTGSGDNLSVSGGTLSHSYNLIQGESVTTGLTTIVSNANPLFINAASGDYRLQASSPAIDYGNNASTAIATDLEGKPRIQGCKIDLGAYESSVAIVPTAGRVYVKAGSTGNGSSWDKAYPNLALPLRLAKTCGITEIWVAEGAYKPMFSPVTNDARDKTFLMVDGVKIYGGFNGTLTGTPAVLPAFGAAGRKGVSTLSGDIDNNNILDDGNAYHVVMVAGNMGAALLDGFTLTGGYGNLSSSVTVNTRGISRYHGAGITVHGKMTFSNLTVKGNIANYGSGIYLNGNSGEGAVFTNIAVVDNTGATDGGGIYSTGTTHTMTNVTVTGNRGDNGGGICIRGGALNIRNSIIWENLKKSGSTIDNTSVSGGTLSHSYNLLQGFTMTSGATNIVANTDPMFTSAAGGNYSLQANSPAIDMGNKALFTAGNTDLAGNPRVQGCNIDLGAYERTVSIVPTAGRVYVKENAAGNGSSWDKAYPNLALPLRLAKICGITEIWVAEGAYKPMFAPTTDAVRDRTFLMVDGVKIYGGFNGTLTGTPTVPPAFGTAGRKGVSTLSGDIGTAGTATDNAYHVVMAAGNMGSALLDGFTVTGGYGNVSSSVTVNTRDISRYHGAGITVHGKMTFSNLTVKANIASYGAGIYLNGNSGEGATFTNIAVTGNTDAQDGGGIYVKGTTHTVTNATVVNNRGDYGGGICIRGGALNLRNSIIWGNTRKNGTTMDNTNVENGTLSHSRNLLQGFTMTTGATNIVANTDPLFTNAASGNYSLQANSPAIDMGNKTLFTAGNTDLAGNPRVQGCNIDLGAYERTVSIVPAAGRVYVKAGGTGNGSSWNNAYPNIALPLRLAKICGITEIWVAEGTYKPMFAPTTDEARDRTFLMVEGVKIYGGFNGTLTGAPAVPPAFGTAGRKGESILSGDIGTAGTVTDNAYHVVMAAGNMGSALLDGFTITGGYGNVSSSVTVNTRDITRSHGAGVTVHGTMIFSNLTVKGNIASYGAGIHLNGNSGEGATFTNIAVSGNTEAQDGGGIYVRAATHTMTNITVAANRGDYGGGICTRGGVLNLRNSIVWGNTRKNGSTVNNIDKGATLNHSYNLVQGESVTTGSVTIIRNDDPKFVSATNYRLQAGSPAIDVGNTGLYSAGKIPDLSGIATDLDGNLRIRNCEIDLGAYEAAGIVVPTNGRVYVKEGSAGNGSSWNNAYPNLAFPLYQAQRGCDGITEIWVAEGTYKPIYSPVNNEARDRTFLMVAGVKIYGGFNGTLTGTPNIPPAFGTAGRKGVSILSGDIGTAGTATDNAYHVVMAAGNMGSALLDGFTITGGYGNSSSSITVNGKSIAKYHGAGITVNGTMTFSNLTVKGNIASSGYGSGIHLDGSGSESSTFTNIAVSGNTEAQDGGGIYVRAATHTMTNITVAANRGDYGGGICTRGGVLNLRNSIVWGNTRKNGSTVNNIDKGATLNHSYNLVQGEPVSAGSTAIISNADPKFIAAGNYRLQAESPAIDIGDNTPYEAGKTPNLTGITKDLDGNTRIQNCKVDLGAYETVGVRATNGIVYVKEGGAGDGSSWDSPYPNLGFPLYLARLGCDGITEIWVAEGAYKPMYSPVNNEARDRTFLMVANVKIYGGFDGTLTGAPVVPPAFGTAGRQGESVLSGDIDNNNVLDAGNVYHVVMAAGNMGSALLDGFTVTGGYGNTSSSMTVNGKSIARYHGAGITVNGTMSFSNLTVKGNIASSGYGSGIHLDGSGSESSTFTNIAVAGNTEAQDGGGIYVRAATHTMTNITVVNNRGDYGGGICIRGGGLNLRNSIVWGNTRKNGSTIDNTSVSGGTLKHSYNLVQNGALSSTGIISNADPQFLSSTDYRLQSKSPAIDRGYSDYYKTGQTPDLTGIITDLGGSRRIQNCIVDLGAYEYEMHGFLEPLNGIMYVNKNTPNPLGDGSSWEDAYPELADVLATAQNMKCIEQIWVAEGTYCPAYIPDSTDNVSYNLTSRDRAFTMVRNVKVYGGFPSNASTANNSLLSSRDWRAYPTVLSGDIGVTDDAADNVYHVVVASGDVGSALLDGFSIVGGHGVDGVASININGTGVSRNSGAGICLWQSASPMLGNLTVSGNEAVNGGGIYTVSSSPVLTNVLISDNTATGNGGGIYSKGSINRGNPVLTNVTVAGNTSGSEGGGIGLSSSGDMTVRNSIVWGNTSSTGDPNVFGAPAFAYSLVEGMYPSGAGNLDGAFASNDPLFVNVSAGDWHLQTGSPAANRANAGYFAAGETPDLSGFTGDLDGNLRIQACAIDMGAYETVVPAEFSDVKPDASGTVYVQKGKTGAGSSWTDAYPELAGALAAAQYNKCIREIWVAVENGQSSTAYHPMYMADFASPAPASTMANERAFVMVGGVKIYGGFRGVETSVSGRETVHTAQGPEQMKYKTVLSGDLDSDDASGTTADNACFVVIAAGNMTDGSDIARLDGFTLTAGNASLRKNIYVNGMEIDGATGGGILIRNASPVIANDSIAGNHNGSGVYIGKSSGSGNPDNSSPVFTRTFVSGNAGGVEIDGNAGTPLFSNTVISGNSEGGVSVLDSPGVSTFVNTLVSGNIRSDGAGMYVYGGSKLLLINVTLAGNYAPAYGGLNNDSGGGVNTVDIRNTVIWNNGSDGVNSALNTSRNSLIEGVSAVGVFDGMDPGNDPLFVSPDIAYASVPKLDGDYRLTSSSPLIDRGDNSAYASAEPFDLDGNIRRQGFAIDPGVYESYGFIPVEAVRDSALTAVSLPVTVDVLSNDGRGSCPDAPLAVFDTVANSGLHHGTLDIIFPDSTFVYTPAAGHCGIDSVAYKIDCSGSADTARVYILILKPLSDEYRACTGASITLGFRHIDGVHYVWRDAGGNIIASPSDSIISIISYSGVTETYYAYPTWRGITFPPHAVTLNPALDAVPEIRDIRVTLCPSPARSIRLTSHLDSLGYFSAVEWTQPSGNMPPAFANVSTGELNTADFSMRGVFTYRYTRYSECLTTSASGKAYVHVPHGRIPPRPDTVLICAAHAEAVNINSIAGVELGGSWNRDAGSDPDDIVRNNMHTASTPSQHAGTVIFDVKTAHQQAMTAANPAYDAAYHGVTGKKFVFEYSYTPSGCTLGGVIRVVIVSF